MEKRFFIYASRWKAIPYLLLGVVLFSMGFCFAFADILGGDIFKKILGFLFGLFFLVAACLLMIISAKRIIKKPVVLDVNSQGVDYYYSVFGNSKKVIKLKWEQIETISFDNFVVYQNKELGDINVSLPSKLSYIKFQVKKGTLDAYSVFKDNLFLSKQKTVLAVVTNSLTNFSQKELQATINYFKCNRDSTNQEPATTTTNE